MVSAKPAFWSSDEWETPPELIAKVAAEFGPFDLDPCCRAETAKAAHGERPLAIDLFTGLHGWAEGLVAEGWRVIGFDLEDMCAQCNIPRPPHVQLIIQDVLTLHGSQFKSADLIVCSPPCQAYSYRAMPWKRAKALPPPDNALFDACFRIQREACEAAGRHIPMVVENVKGAQPWVGRARWHYGSYYLWGDVPALMPFGDGVKAPGFRLGPYWNTNHRWRKTGSKSPERKRIAAEIAKIPFTLSRHIARVFKPQEPTP